MSQNKNNKNKVKKEVFYEDFTMSSDIANWADHIVKKSIELGKQYQDFRYKRNDWKFQANSDLETFGLWLPHFIQAYEVDALKGELEFLQLTNKSNLSHAPSVEHFFKSYNFFNNFTWPARISNRIAGKFLGFSLEMKKYLIGLMCKLLDGYVFAESTNIITVLDCPGYTKFFSTQLGKSQRHLIWMIGVERLPKLTTNKQTVQRFDYVHYMKFIDVVHSKDMQRGTPTMSCQRVLYDNRKDPARQDFSANLQMHFNRAALFQESETFTGYAAVEFVEIRSAAAKYSPNKFKSVNLSENEKSTMIFDARNQRWKTGLQSRMLDGEGYNQYLNKMNQETIRDKANFKNASQIVDFLKTIPNFRIKLTPEQNSLVGEADNVVALGRSGTGKTTCAILRLFSMEVLFKFRMTLAKIKHEGLVKDTKFEAQDLDNIYGLHCVFVTASPVLSNEVQRYYHRLTGQVKEELKNKQKRILEKKRLEAQKKQEEEAKKKAEQENNEENYETIAASKEAEAAQREEEAQEEAAEALKMAEEGIKGIEIDQPELEAMDEDILDEEEADNEIVKNMAKLNSLRHVKEESFPLFLTVKRLVLLIDGCLSRPFFARNIKDQIIGLDANAQWHNEMKGVMMIGNYHRKLKDFDKTVKKAAAETEAEGESEISNSDSDDSEEELEEEEFAAEYQREVNQRARQQNQKNRRLGGNQYKLSFEIEYEYFEKHFWFPVVMRKTPYLDLHPLLVWSEIQSHIKGSANSHLYPGQYLPERVYFELDGQKKNFLTKEKKFIIFDIFGRYERWKRGIGAYDFMDVVNYALSHIRFHGYTGAPIHYLMIDEVQDLTHSTILLFMKITNMGLFFSGDTAQTIAKGVGLRFSDLRSLFKIKEEMYYNSYYSNTWKTPVIKQLTVNFRSHGKILEVANSVVTLIETFFPRTIDKLKKEKSEIDGPKPILLADVDLDALFSLLFGVENYKSARHSENKGSLTSSQVEFGCNQVIIVRDQESKDKLPPLLKHALVLTVYEAKGLEFDDVILYNFFSDSDVDHQKWKLLESISVEDMYLDEFEYNQRFFTFDKEKKLIKEKAKKEAEEKKEGEGETEIEKDKKKEEDSSDDEEEELNGDSVQMFNSSLDITTSKYTIKKVSTNINRKQFDFNPYSMLCTELKQLYVAITRPKNRLIIYDDSRQNRKCVEEYWKKLDLVQVISSKDLASNAVGNKEVESFKALVVKTNASEWKKQGVRMFKNKYYEQAMKCFEKSGDEDLKFRAQAYFMAENTSNKSSEISSKKMYIKQDVYPYSSYSKNMKRGLLKTLKEQEKALRKDFLKAGETFEKIGLLKQAAQCYFSAEKFNKAFNAYDKIGYHKQAAEAAYMMKDFQRAAEYYDKGGDYMRAIDCLAEIKQYEKVLDMVEKYKDMPTEQRESFAKKYVPLALKALLTNVDYNIEDIEEKKKEQEEQEKKKKVAGLVGSYPPAKIQEVDEDEEEEESDEEESESEEDDEEEEQEAKPEEGELKKEEEVAEQKQEEQPQESQNEVSNMSFNNNETKAEVQAEVEVQAQPKKEVSDMSFEIIGGSDGKSKDVSIISFDDSIVKPKSFGLSKKQGVEEISFEDVGSVNVKANVTEKLEDYEHLSHIDPEDEWLRMETGSIVEKLSAIRRQDSASYSEYSAIDFNHVMQNQCTLVKTKNDIFAQDAVMQKIIRYIGMFSAEVKQSLWKLRSKKTLLSQRNPGDLEQDSMIDLMVDLDEINTDFIYLILDLLEHYKLYKLCIFVCNRYGLSQKLGRYLVNIASKYSNFPSESISVNKIRLLNQVQRQMQHEKSFIASLAFHNVLENINPDFLRLKKKGESVDFSNSLGNECFSELINLGFWKKSVFLMDYENSLAVSATFASFKSYKLICLKENEEYGKVENINSLLANENFEFLPFKTPSNEEEIKHCMIALDSVLWDLTEKFPIYLSKDALTHGAEGARLEMPAFASFFAFNGILWNYVYNRSSENAQLFEKYLSDALSNLSKILQNADFKSPIIELRIYDLIVFFVQLTLLYPKVQEIEDDLLNLPDNKFEELINIFNSLLVMTNNILRTSKYHETIMRALVTPFRVRFIEKCKVLEHISNSYYVAHVSSPLISDIISFKTKEELTENPLTSSVLFDLDGNFIATPINVVLSCIRKKLVVTMKNLVNARIKTIVGATYDESAERVERYIHVVGLIECYRFAAHHTDENKAQGNAGMYSKPTGPKNEDPIYAQVKAELKSRLKQLDEIENDVDTYMPEEKEILAAGLQKEIKRIREFMKKKAIKMDHLPFETQKQHYLKTIKKNCRSVRGNKVRMNPFVRQAILGHLFQKVNNGLAKDKLSYNYVNMFYMLGEEVYLAEILRKHKKNACAQSVQLYSDAIGYRKFYCAEEYANSLFEFMSGVFSSLNIGQKVALLEDVAPMIVMATALKDKKKSIKVVRETLKELQDLDGGLNETAFTLKKDIPAAESDDALGELIHWVEKVSMNLLRDFGNFSDFEAQKLRSSLLRILLNVIVNKEKLDTETLKKLKYALRSIVESDLSGKGELQVFLKYSTAEDFARLSQDLQAGKSFIPQKFVTINLESDPKKAALVYEKCDQAYLNDQVMVAKHINLRKAILKFYNKKNFAKIKAKVDFDCFEHNYILNTFKNLADHKFVLENIFLLVKKNSGLLQLFYEINNFLKRSVHFFFKNKLDNPLDFHYIMNLLHAIAKIGTDYAGFIRELTIQKQFSPENNKMFVKKKVEVNELEKEFERWANTIEIKEDLSNKVKKKRVIGVKWEERALKSSLKQVKKPAKKTSSKNKNIITQDKNGNFKNDRSELY